MDIDPNSVQLWFHYEEIAMHFNQLIIQYRLQLMAGIGAIGAVSGYLISSKDISVDMRHKYVALVSTGLLMILAAAATLDLCYYNELLRGAVKALLEFEKQHTELYMSTYIKEQFPGGASLRIYIAYALVIVPLLCFTVWSWYEAFFKTGKTKNG